MPGRVVIVDVEVFALFCLACGHRIVIGPDELEVFAPWWSAHRRPVTVMRQVLTEL